MSVRVRASEVLLDAAHMARMWADLSALDKKKRRFPGGFFGAALRKLKVFARRQRAHGGADALRAFARCLEAMAAQEQRELLLTEATPVREPTAELLGYDDTEPGG